MQHWESIWSPEYMLDRIYELHRKGYPLNAKYVYENDRAFEGAVTKYFGSWDEALKKAGLDVEQIRLQDRRIKYNSADVIAELRKRKSSGLPLNHRALYKEDLRLCNAAHRIFGSYSAALEAAGIDPEKIRIRRRPYSKSDRGKVLRAIRKTASLSEEKRAPAIQRLRREYGKVVRRLFRGWTAAANAAGMKYRAIHPKDHRDLSSRSKVILALKKRLKSRLSLVRYILREDDRRLFKMVLKYFQNYYDCYPPLGLSRSQVRGQRRYANRDETIAQIRKRYFMGLGIHSRDLVFGPSRDYALYNSVMKFLGGWPNALKIAGILSAPKIKK
ncbi:hypothetical protein L0222_01995 [bacterium]|nr:hypothetical protein [bacterium]